MDTDFEDTADFSEWLDNVMDARSLIFGATNCLESVVGLTEFELITRINAVRELLDTADSYLSSLEFELTGFAASEEIEAQ